MIQGILRPFFHALPSSLKQVPTALLSVGASAIDKQRRNVLKHADFMRVVEMLHGPYFDDKAKFGSRRTGGGLWDQTVQPRPSVLHDLPAEDRALVKFLVQGDNEYHPADTLEVVATFVDLDYGSRLNFPHHKQLTMHMFADKRVCLGTTHDGGAWVVTRAGDRDLIGTVIPGRDRRRLGVQMAIPLGISRRADREGPYCLVTGADSTAVERRLAGKVLRLIEDAREQGVTPSTKMPQLDFIVAVDGKFTMRSESESYFDHVQARCDMSEGIARTTSTGKWGIPGVPDMVCDMVGEVKSIDGFNITVSDGCVERIYAFDPEEANNIASERTGFDLPYVEPIVRVGQKLMPGASLFGPWPVERVEDVNDVPGLAAKLGGNPQLALDQLRACFILTKAKQLPDERYAYPLGFVVPQSLSDVRVRVPQGPQMIAGPAESRGEQYGRDLTPVRYRLQAQGTGYAIDLYSDAAHKAAMWAVERERMRKVREHKDRQAAQKKQKDVSS